MIKKKEIVDAVAQASGMRKREVRAVVEAMLPYLHGQLKAGEEIQVPPLGKIRIITQNEGTARQKQVYRLILSKDKPASEVQEETQTEVEGEDQQAAE